MKELSVEEKARAYDEAIERAIKIISGEGVEAPPDWTTCEVIFPELKKSEDESIRKALIDYFNDFTLPTFEGLEPKKILAWLEKQDGITNLLSDEDENRIAKVVLSNCASSFINYLETHKYEGKMCVSNEEWEDIENAFHNAMWDRLHRYYCKYIEKQGEQKPADKVEPKFKVGDWIVINGFTILITDVHNDLYDTIFENGEHRIYDTNVIDKDAHLWTIKDAKDGDVLFQDLMGGKTFIYNGVNPDMAILYSFIISNDGEDVLPYHIGKPNTGIGYIEENKNIIHPATKEQRDTLFATMKEAGYEWDAEKKELKKVEQKSSEWTEEDERKLESIIDSIRFLSFTHPEWKPVYDGDIEWLNGIKDRIYLQPRQEWTEEDSDAIEQAIIALEDMFDKDHPLSCYSGYKLPFDKAAERLKSIKNRIFPQTEEG